MAEGDKPLLDKLGVKPEARISVVEFDDPAFLAQLATRTGEVQVGTPQKESDLIFAFVAHRDDLGLVAPLKKYLKPNGAIWVIRPRGTQDIKEIDIIDAGKRAGLVDNKIARFSDSFSAMRLVIPLALR